MTFAAGLRVAFVEHLLNFELLISLKAVKSLGVSVPQSLLERADEALE